MQSINRAAAPSVKKGVSEAPTVGNPGGICSKQDSELAAGCAGGRGHRVARPGQVGAASGGGCAGGIPQRPRQDAALIDDGRHDRSEATASAGLGAALREQAAAPVRAPDRSESLSCCPSFTFTDSPKEISSWRCADCSATARRSRHRRSSGCGRSGNWSSRRGEAGGWTISK